MDVLDNLLQVQVLPDLFVLLHDLEHGDVQPKDFESHAGSIRLKLGQMRAQLLEIDDISRTSKEREEQIELLECQTRKMAQFLRDLHKVDWSNGLPVDLDMEN